MKDKQPVDSIFAQNLWMSLLILEAWPRYFLQNVQTHQNVRVMSAVAAHAVTLFGT